MSGPARTEEGKIFGVNFPRFLTGFFFGLDFEAQIREMQAARRLGVPEGEQDDANGEGRDVPKENDRVGLNDIGVYDADIYSGGKSKFEGYHTSLALDEADEDDEPLAAAPSGGGAKRATYTAPLAVIKDVPSSEENFDPLADRKRARIIDREDDYRKRRMNQIISPVRVDPFANGGATPDVGSRGYSQIMKETMLKKDEVDLQRQMRDKAKDGTLKVAPEPRQTQKRRGRWDMAAATPEETPAKKIQVEKPLQPWDPTPGRKEIGGETPGAGATPSVPRMWDPTPAHTSSSMTPGRETPGHSATMTPGRRNRWDETPRTERETPGHGAGWAETPRTDRGGGDKIVSETPTPSASKRRSRWDETPSATPAGGGGATPGSATPAGATPVGATPGGMTPGGMTPRGMMTPSGATPMGSKAMGMATPSPAQLLQMTPDQLQAYRWEQEIDQRNRPLSDEELDAMFPPGYKVLQPPAGYIPIRTPGRRLAATPTPMVGQTPTGFYMQPDTPAGGDKLAKAGDVQPKGQNLPFLKPEDAQYFDKLLVDVDEDTLSPEEKKERLIMELLLKIKNGTPPMRKSALRRITDKAREFGAGPLFNQILPLLMSPTLEDQERHLLVKVIDRVLYKLDDLVRPYVHKILVVIEPLLIDEDYYARVEGREIISNLAKAAGLATMISTMRPDIDNIDEYVRNTTARAFAVVASSLGIPSLLPFLKAVCKSKKSWQARHTGIKIVQQIAILMGCAILPHLRSLVEIIEHGLVDDQQKVRTITALGLAALAEAATPYGIESFDSVLKPLWKGIRTHRGKGLAAFLKAIGYLIPLMDAEYANYYTKEVMVILIREFQSPDEEMKKIVLKVVKQCCSTDGVEAQYIKDEILPHFFKYFWNHRMALDRRNYRQLVDTTVEIANRVGASEIINRLVDDLKDENEQYRKMVMESIEKIMEGLGAADIDSRLEEQLIDGILYAFQEQTTEVSFMPNSCVMLKFR